MSPPFHLHAYSSTAANTDQIDTQNDTHDDAPENATLVTSLLVLDDPWEFPETTAAIRRAMARGAAVLAASKDPGGLPALLGASMHLVDGAPG